MSEKIVELKVNTEFYENIEATLKKHSWLGYESVEEFIIEAIRKRVEQLRENEAFIRNRMKRL